MKRFPDMVSEQAATIARLREEATKYILSKINDNRQIAGVLLTGSVARGDGRIGPWGIYVDITLVLRDGAGVDLDALFGKNEEPYIPKHCINLYDKVGVAVGVTSLQALNDIRTMPESNIFAMNESLVIFDPDGLLETWKRSAFVISDEDVRARALQQYFRLDYLINDYRMEKWNYREASVQIAQNFNEAGECYLTFLYCINKRFIPRKDWLAYLTYDLATKPPTHERDIEAFYLEHHGPEGLEARRRTLAGWAGWMLDFSKTQGWL
jgi:hypothetical protein